MRKTKIVATLGPATDSPEMIGQLVDAGVNIFRLNMSHAAHDWVRRVVADIREAAKAREISVGVLMDTQGPSIRTGDVPVALNLQRGQKFTFTVRGEKSEEEHSVDVNYDNLVNDIHVGDVVLVDNGEIEMRVLSKTANRIECEVLTPGQLKSRRHINLPGVRVSLPALTAKDLQDIALGLELEVDYIALSFVREAKDLRQLRAVIQHAKQRPQIIAKLEDQQAIKNLKEIIQETDGIMVARGDLGIEVPYEELPIIQRRAVKYCLRLGKPVIVATHMLESMINTPIPTRAEVTDVANAVYEQADAIMLSGETTVGKYPLKCLEVFNRVAKRIEKSGGANFQENAELTNAEQRMIKSGVVMADELRADAILVLTLSGTSARYTSWMRPRHSPIFAICNTKRVADSLTLNWGVTPFVLTFDEVNRERTISRSISLLLQRGALKPGNTVVVISSIEVDGHYVRAVQMRQV
ncbi:MAG: pyruvate kinase [Limisphaerales bacterium]